jgi:hypothetical protein
VPDEATSLLGTKRKKFKNDEPRSLEFFLKILTIVSIIESYFILIYFMDEEKMISKVISLVIFKK